MMLRDRSAMWLIASFTLLGACRSAAPRLLRLTPASADVTAGSPVFVLVEGRGFAPTNTVRFGAIELRQVPRRSSRALQFQVPADDAQRPARGDAPPAPLPSGRYDVSVTTARGTSNALPFDVKGVAR